MTTKKQAHANKRIAQASAAKRGDMMRGKTRTSGNNPYPKEGGKLQHQYKMEKKLGRKLRSGEVVHHKDENRSNNSDSNLKVMRLADHVSHHRSKK